MASKQVTDRQKSAQAVSASARAHATLVQRAFVSRFTPLLRKGEKLPDLELVLELCARELDARADTMVDADEAHVRELGDDDTPRNERDAAIAALTNDLIEARGVLAGLYGPDTARALGFDDRTPQDPVQLARFGRRVALELRSVKLPKPRLVQGVVLDTHAVADALDKRCLVLERSLEDVAREAREAQATLGTRNLAVDQYDDSFGDVAAVQVALLKLAGRDDLADRVRPSTRNPGRIDPPAEQQPEPQTATG